MRVGRQIVLFTNRYLPSKIELIKSVSHKRNNEHVQMPAEYIPKLHEFLTEKLALLQQETSTKTKRRTISKILGECPLS